MITTVIYAKIRRMYFREHLTINEIKRRTSLPRSAIRKWLKEAEEPQYQRRKCDGKLTPFELLLKQALKADVHCPKRDRRLGSILFEAIQKGGHTGCYAQVTKFLRNDRNHAAVTGESAYVPLKLELGEAFQFDWSEGWLVMGGIHHKLQAAHTRLCASCAVWLAAYPTQSHEMLFDAHTRVFTALGGVLKRGIPTT